MPETEDWFWDSLPPSAAPDDSLNGQSGLDSVSGETSDDTIITGDGEDWFTEFPDSSLTQTEDGIGDSLPPSDAVDDTIVPTEYEFWDELLPWLDQHNWPFDDPAYYLSEENYLDYLTTQVSMVATMSAPDLATLMQSSGASPQIVPDDPTSEEFGSTDDLTTDLTTAPPVPTATMPASVAITQYAVASSTQSRPTYASVVDYGFVSSSTVA